MVKIGDKVKFLNDVGGGTVKSFSGKNIVNVENEDGFEVPTLISELVVERDELAEEPSAVQIPKDKEFVSTPNIKTEQEKIIETVGNADEFCLAFVPVNQNNPVNGDIEAYLLNVSKFKVLYNFSHVQANRFTTEKFGALNENSKLYLESFSQNDLNDLPDFYFQLMFFKTVATKVELPIYKRIKVNPVKFYKENSYSRSSFLSGKAMLIKIENSDFEDELEELTNKEIKKVIREKEGSGLKKKPLTVTDDLVEIDLHIHELLDDIRGLSNHEMLKIQMDKFREEMENAIRNKVKRIVFIHGLGNGTLKQELRKELNYKYKKYAMQDASFQEYGFGATMVILRRG